MLLKAAGDDPFAARPYLELAVADGASDAAIDLAIAAIFVTSKPGSHGPF
jgi:hypothetical protein